MSDQIFVYSTEQAQFPQSVMITSGSDGEVGARRLLEAYLVGRPNLPRSLHWKLTKIVGKLAYGVYALP